MRTQRSTRDNAKRASAIKAVAPDSRNLRKPPREQPAAKEASDVWNLRLYVAGDSPKSKTALDNLRRLCDSYLEGNYRIEVVDLKRRPDLAKADQILALPTLIRKIPEPMKRVIGDLSNAERALVGLDLAGAKQLRAKRAGHAK